MSQRGARLACRTLLLYVLIWRAGLLAWLGGFIARFAANCPDLVEAETEREHSERNDFDEAVILGIHRGSVLSFRFAVGIADAAALTSNLSRTT